MYETTSLWVNYGNICDFACSLKLSTLYLFNRVVHLDDAIGFNGYIESVEMFNYYKAIPYGLIAARMIYLCEKYKIPKRAGGTIRFDSIFVQFIALLQERQLLTEQRSLVILDIYLET